MKPKRIVPERSEREIEIRGEDCVLSGTLTLPDSPYGLVLFAHGSGSSRKSPRNQFVAGILNQAHLGTLLFDLLTLEEESEDAISGRYRFDIGFLAARLVAAIDWAKTQLPDLKFGLFGASTGAAAALVAAAERSHDIFAVVSRGGRPDLAGPYLNHVYAPTLLLVGEKDDVVIDLNREAMAQIPGEKRLIIVPNATHLFAEEGALEEVANHAKGWFDFFLCEKARKV